jgi:magnesium transporter
MHPLFPTQAAMPVTSTSAHQEELEDVGPRVGELIAAGDTAAAGELAGTMHASDLADLVEGLDEDLRIPLLSSVPLELASGALAEMEAGSQRVVLLSSLAPDLRAALLRELADDDVADLLGELDAPAQRAILETLSAEEAGELADLLRYPEDSAGGLMTTDLVAVDASLSAAQAIEEVRVQGREVEDFYTVFVVDGGRRLLGTVRLDDLVIADPASSVGELVEPAVATVLPVIDQEDVAHLIARYNVAALPVVGDDGGHPAPRGTHRRGGSAPRVEGRGARPAAVAEPEPDHGDARRLGHPALRGRDRPGAHARVPGADHRGDGGQLGHPVARHHHPAPHRRRVG